MGRLLAEESLGQGTPFPTEFIPKDTSDVVVDKPKKEKPQVGLTTPQKWLAVIGITALCYYILYKSGSIQTLTKK